MPLDFLWFDFETSGLHPERGSEILEVQFVRTDFEGKEIASYYSKVKPTRPVSAESAMINGYNEKDWESALPFPEVYRQLQLTFPRGDKLRPSGWNISFDIDHLYFHAPGLLQLSHHPFDLMSYGWELIEHLPQPKLVDLAEILGVDTKGAHSANGDVRMMVECFRKIRERKKDHGRRGWGSAA